MGMQWTRPLQPMQVTRASEVQQENTDDPARMSDIVKFWSLPYQYGFIVPADGSDDVFVAKNRFAEGTGSLRKGEEVTFIKAEFNKTSGKYGCMDVRKVAHGYKGGSGEFDDSNVKRGQVCQWKHRREYGYILDEDQDEIFFHETALEPHLWQGEDAIQVGDYVKYVEKYDKGKQRLFADKVRL